MRPILLLLLLGAAIWSVGEWRRTRTLSAFSCAYLQAHPRVCAVGRFEQAASDRWELEGSLLEARELGSSIVLGKVLFFGSNSENRHLRGRHVRICGRLSCAAIRRNPSGREDRWLDLGARAILGRLDRSRIEPADPADTGRSWRTWAREVLDRSTRGKYPGLHALGLAVWVSDRSELSEDLARFYRQTGLLFILALSGQHVVVLAGVIAYLEFLVLKLLQFSRVRPRDQAMLSRWFREHRLLLASLLLCVTSATPASVRRAAAMVGALYLLDRRGLNCSVFTRIASCAGLLMVYDPTLIADAGFMLSVVTTVMVVQVYRANQRRAYWLASVSVPLCSAPLVLFFFSKCSWLTPIYAAVLGGVWSFLWIPIGFLVPLLVWCPPIARIAEASWNFFSEKHVDVLRHLPTGEVLWYRPNGVETFFLIGITLWVAAHVICLITKNKTDME